MRVRERVAEWAQLGASAELLGCIKHGVKLVFNKETRRKLARNTKLSFDQGRSLDKLAPDEREFLEAETTRLLKIGAWEECPESAVCCISRVFLVPKKGSKKYRLVIDLRELNATQTPATCEVETLRELRAQLRPKDHMVAMDLTDGYFHLSIREEDRKYFGFRIGSRTFRMVAVPFGWNHAPRLFTMLMQPLVQEMRAPGSAGRRRERSSATRPNKERRTRGARMLVYMDDFLLMAKTKRATANLRDRFVSLAARLGLALQKEKCVWEPTRRLVHLGLVVDSEEGLFQVDEIKASKCRTLAKQILSESARSQRRVPKRQLAQLVGLAQFFDLAVKGARFHLRELHDVIGSLQGWAGRVVLTKQALRDLRYWCQLRAASTGMPIWRPIETAVLHTDSSDFAWGAVLNGDHPARGLWTATEAEHHITLKELMAVTRAIHTYAPLLAGKHVLHYEDNQAVVAVINSVTSRSPAMMAELRKLWAILDANSITLHTTYIRSEENVLADDLSRLVDEDDWVLCTDVFELLQARTAHTVDRFSSPENARLPRFNTRWAAPGSEAVDALSLPDSAWRLERNWCNPPWSLLLKLALKLEQSGAAATVLTPDWPRATWFPLLTELADTVMRFRAKPGLFVPGRSHAQRRTMPPPRWDVLAFCIPSRPPRKPLATAGDFFLPT